MYILCMYIYIYSVCMYVCMYVHAHTRTHEVIFLGSNAPISHWLASADSVRQSLSLALSSGELANSLTRALRSFCCAS